MMNGSFIGFGALLVVGAVLLSRPLGPLVPWVTGLLLVSGLSSVATGLAPLDQDATLHAIAAAPLFVAQPVALIVLGARLRSDRPRLAGALLAAGVVTAQRPCRSRSPVTAPHRVPSNALPCGRCSSGRPDSRERDQRTSCPFTPPRPRGVSPPRISPSSVWMPSAPPARPGSDQGPRLLTGPRRDAAPRWV